MKELYSNRGDVILVDDEDFDYLKQFTWWLNRKGYAYTQRTVNRKVESYMMHRLIMGAEKGQIIDHINRNKLDNRKENLRFVTYGQNTANTIRINKTGFRGVQKRYNKYVAYIKSEEKEHYLGIYATAEEAAVVYNKAAKELYGKYAILNEV